MILPVTDGTVDIYHRGAGSRKNADRLGSAAIAALPFLFFRMVKRKRAACSGMCV